MPRECCGACGAGLGACGPSPYLRECCSQESSTGGGAGVNVVAVLMSPMIVRASLRAWYMRSISSRRWACSADSSIRVFWSSEEYSCARSSEFMKSLTCQVSTGKESGNERASGHTAETGSEPGDVGPERPLRERGRIARPCPPTSRLSCPPSEPVSFPLPCAAAAKGRHGLGDRRATAGCHRRRARWPPGASTALSEAARRMDGGASRQVGGSIFNQKQRCEETHVITQVTHSLVFPVLH